MKYAFDIDGVLCSNEAPDSYEYAMPFMDVIERVNELYEEGHTIILYTGRGSGSGKDYRRMTERQMGWWGVCYHEMWFGKPPADVFIDDKAINGIAWAKGKEAPHEFLARETGTCNRL